MKTITWSLKILNPINLNVLEMGNYNNLKEIVEKYPFINASTWRNIAMKRSKVYDKYILLNKIVEEKLVRKKEKKEKKEKKSKKKKEKKEKKSKKEENKENVLESKNNVLENKENNVLEESKSLENLKEKLKYHNETLKNDTLNITMEA